MTRAIVFAYHNVGVRCLKVLRAHAIEIPLVLTHKDSSAEAIWFDSVARTADDCRIPVITPDDPNVSEIVERIGRCQPDFIFSFYYRTLLKAPLLASASRGALNMHGSLLPKYRGRAPVNWAIIHGERETGATLHYMTEKPDAGDIVDQAAVPILPDDSAREVFDKVTVAAEVTLDRVLPALIGGTAPRVSQDLSRGAYFGGRTPEDGTIDWSRDARTVHDLVRAVAPPYPGARTVLAGQPARVLRTRVEDPSSRGPAALAADRGRLIAQCGGGGTLVVHELEIAGTRVDAAAFAERFGTRAIAPGN